jgi:hypothetical protein
MDGWMRWSADNRLAARREGRWRDGARSDGATATQRTGPAGRGSRACTPFDAQARLGGLGVGCVCLGISSELPFSLQIRIVGDCGPFNGLKSPRGAPPRFSRTRVQRASARLPAALLNLRARPFLACCFRHSLFAPSVFADDRILLVSNHSSPSLTSNYGVPSLERLRRERCRKFIEASRRSVACRSRGCWSVSIRVMLIMAF